MPSLDPSLAASILPWSDLARDGAVAVILVRHGRTAWNQQRRFLGRTDIPLDEQGQREALALARRLAAEPLHAIVSSPLRRAAQTAAFLGRDRGLELVLHPELVELAQGELEGQPDSVLLERYPDFLAQWLDDPTHARVPGGETLGECQERSVAAILEIAAATPPGQAVAIVSHQMVIASALCAVLDLPLRRFRELGHRNAAFSVLRCEGGQLRLLLPEQAAHLERLG